MFAHSEKSGKRSSPVTSSKTTQSTDLMTYQLLFFPRKGKENKHTKLSPLYCRITCGKRTELSFNKWIPVNKWNSKKQRLSGTDSETVAINAFIKEVSAKFHVIH